MTTVMFVLHAKEDADHTEASTYWRTTHADIASSIPGVRAYTQFHATSAPDGSAPPFLGVASLLFDDETAFATAAGTPEFAAAIADLDNFADSSQMPTSFVEPVAVVG